MADDYERDDFYDRITLTTNAQSAEEQKQQQQGILDESLIEEVRKFRCIWDPSCRAYKETPRKQLAWSEISKKLGKEGNFCIVLITTI